MVPLPCKRKRAEGKKEKESVVEQRKQRNWMADDSRQISYDLDSKWDACLDLSLRRVLYSSLACGVAGILLLRSPVTRWASVAFGAGLGLGSAYSDCSQLFNRPASTATFTPSSISQPSQASNVLVSEDTHS